MKDYEKVAVGIGIAALGLASYQALKTKQATDAVTATDPSKSPIRAAADLSKNIIGGTVSWFRQRYDNTTGFVKGKSDKVLDSIWASPATVVYHYGGKAVDMGRDATEAGTKFVWGLGANRAKSGKEKKEPLTNKAFTLMGSVTSYIYEGARNLPANAASIADMATGVGSNLEKTDKSTVDKIKKYSLGLLPSLRRRR